MIASIARLRPITHRDVLAIAVPILLSNVTTPLVGLVDTAVIGQLGEPALIGGVAIGTMIFSLLFWSFGFLRMGTSGLTAQADGAGHASEIAATLQRALLIAVVVGIGLIGLGGPIATLAFQLIEGSAAAEAAARTYYDIRLLSAPAVLANYALLGWFIGLGKASTAFVLQLLLNGLNLGLSVVLVLWANYAVAGVGVAALTAEVAALTAGIALAVREVGRRGGFTQISAVLQRAAMARMLNVNSDIMIRTLAMMLAFSFFTAQGAKSGDVLLAANTILVDFFAVSAYFLDGFAHAAETLVGRAVGARRRDRFIEAARLSSLWAAAISVVVTLCVLVGGGLLIDLMTTSGDVRAVARQYLGWTAVTPLVGFAAFQLDGIFIGATRTADMRNMMLISVCVFFAAWALLTPLLGNHGLWASLLVFLVIRALTLVSRVPALLRQSFPPPAAAISDSSPASTDR